MTPINPKPILFDAIDAHIAGIISYDHDGTALLVHDAFRHAIPPEKQFDLTQATLFGLNERLTSNATSPKMDGDKNLRDLFNEEWKIYERALSAAQGLKIDYGVYAYYPRTGDLVKYCPEFWHHIVATASSSMLLTDPLGRLSWKEIRAKLSSTVVAVAGASVGSSALHAIVMDIRPTNIKIADKGRYKMENINRVRLSYNEITESNRVRNDVVETLLRNKAEVVSEQVYSIDPFMNVFTYANGVDDQDFKRFFDGDPANEPPAQIIVEEVDDPRIKIMLRKEARRRGLPLLMVSDLGSSLQLDVMRYDKDHTLPLAHGVSDHELEESMESVYRHPGDRQQFFAFVDKLIGTNYRQHELERIILGSCEIPTSTIIPQLGSTAMAASGVMGEAVARIILGENYPPRMIFNKKTFAIQIEN